MAFPRTPPRADYRASTAAGVVAAGATGVTGPRPLHHPSALAAGGPEVQALQEFWSTDTWANLKAKASSDITNGGWITANKGLDPANLVNPIDKLSATILLDPKSEFRFDGSDQMPAAVGSGAFWKGMTDWVLGASTSSTLDKIEAAWPTS